MMKRLNGKVAAVTGGNSGHWSDNSEAFSERGSRESLFLVDRSDLRSVRGFFSQRNGELWEVEDMNQSAISRQPRNPGCVDSMRLAERELAAFFGAVTELFGRELAELSAEEWLRELEATENLPASTREWRWLTAKVSARLANRMNTFSLSTEFATT